MGQRYCALCGTRCSDRICQGCKDKGYTVDEQGNLHHGMANIIVNTVRDIMDAMIMGR